MSGYLRVATKEDMELLFVWANEEAVRRNSFSQKEIGYEEHQQWYQKLLNNKNSKQYIYVQDEVDIGQARVDIIGDEAEVGYSICKEKRGNGYGSELLQLLIEQVRQDFPQVKKIVGKVKPENIASQKAFIKAGYRESYFVFEQCVNEI